MNKPTVTLKNGQIKTVKNLGWLLKHASEVQSITVQQFLSHDYDCLLTAYLSDGRVYRAEWQSTAVCLQWLKRPSLRHANIGHIA